MKIAKILSAAAASVVAATALATAASAELVKVEGGDAGLTSATGMWLVQVYNEGNPDENKPATDFGIDLAAVDGIRVTFTPADTEWFEGNCGGAIVFSANGGDIAQGSDLWDTYNWTSASFWGVNDDALTHEDGTPYTAAEDQAIQAVKVGDYTYTLTWTGVNNPIANGDASTIGCMQVAMQEWGSDMSEMKVLKLEVLDASGNVLVAFDENGTPSVANQAGGSTGGAATGDDKGSPDTGVESVAAVAGLAVVAAGAIVLSRKRK